MTEHREITELEIEQIIDDLNETDNYEYWEFTVAGDDGYNQNGIKNQYLISPDKMIRLNRTVYEDGSPSEYTENVSKWENE